MKKKRKHFPIDVLCAKCGTLLYHYDKDAEGDTLVKCYKDRILIDYTNGSLSCPGCGIIFARERMVHGKPANVIIQGKVRMKGFHGKS